MTQTVARTTRTLRTLAMTAVAPAVAIALLVCPGASPATAAPAETEQAPVDPANYRAPGQGELDAKRADVQRLAAQVTDSEAALAAARTRVGALQHEVNHARGQEAAAQQAEAEARAEQQHQNARLQAAARLVAQGRGEMGRWASSTYRNGTTGGVEEFLALMGAENTDDLGQRAQMLQLVGRWRGSVVTTLEQAEAVEADAKARADAAATAATAHAGEAEAARLRAEQSLSEQTTQLMLVQTLLDQQRSAAASAASDMDSMSAAMNAAASAMYAPDNVIAGPTGPDCPGGDISGFANGHIPTHLLCAPTTAPNHRLRADAAHAFDQMSQAYQGTFGSPLCITDSYRTYASQVSLKARKPGLAARPGTSNHGLGRAVDLCGGIQSFGAPQHQWMVQNATRFGWCHPTWAQRTGSKPEAWHWEYRNCR